MVKKFGEFFFYPFVLLKFDEKLVHHMSVKILGKLFLHLIKIVCPCLVLVEKRLLVDIQLFLDLRLKLFGDKEGLHMLLESSERVFISLKTQGLVKFDDAFPHIFVRDLEFVYFVRKSLYFGQEKVF